jgi:hypothetical protein
VAGHTPEKEGPTPDAATHWLSLSERGRLNSRERRGFSVTLKIICEFPH